MKVWQTISMLVLLISVIGCTAQLPPEEPPTEDVVEEPVVEEPVVEEPVEEDTQDYINEEGS